MAVILDVLLFPHVVLIGHIVRQHLQELSKHQILLNNPLMCLCC